MYFKGTSERGQGSAASNQSKLVVYWVIFTASNDILLTLISLFLLPNHDQAVWNLWNSNETVSENNNNAREALQLRTGLNLDLQPLCYPSGDFFTI